MNNENPWEQIEQPKSKIAGRVIDSTHPFNIYYAKDQGGKYLLIFYAKDKFPKIKLPKLKGFKIYFSQKQDMLIIELNESDNWTLFKHMCDDIVANTRTTTGDKETVKLIINRILKWQRYWETDSKDLMSNSKIIGLLGELYFLENHLFPSFPIEKSIDYWSGPESKAQDFLVDSIAVEVKCQLGESPSRVTINSSDQLCPKFPELYLHVITLGKVEKDSANAFNLFDTVDRINNKILKEAPSAYERFSDLLLLVGYIAKKEYKDYSFTFLDELTFKVVEGFPRICTENLPSGIDKVRYRITLNSCMPFESELKWEEKNVK